MPQRAFPLRGAQVAELQLRSFEPCIVAIGALKVEPIDRDAIEVARAHPDRRCREAGDRAPRELVLGDEALELDARLDHASVGGSVTHPARIAGTELRAAGGAGAVRLVARRITEQLEHARLDALGGFLELGLRFAPRFT